MSREAYDRNTRILDEIARDDARTDPARSMALAQTVYLVLLALLLVVAIWNSPAVAASASSSVNAHLFTVTQAPTRDFFLRSRTSSFSVWVANGEVVVVSPTGKVRCAKKIPDKARSELRKMGYLGIYIALCERR